MKLSTSRFGELEIPSSLIIRMTKPVLGFEQLKEYVIIQTDDFKPFKWLQSVDDPEVAFAIVDPLLFFPDYLVEVIPKEIEELRELENFVMISEEWKQRSTGKIQTDPLSSGMLNRIRNTSQLSGRTRTHRRSGSRCQTRRSRSRCHSKP